MENFDKITIDGTPLSEQEKFILEKVLEGSVADLVLEYGPDPRSRRLRSSFLISLLTGKIKRDKFRVHRKGILIANATVGGDIDLEEARIQHSVYFGRCYFLDKVIFRDAHSTRHLFFEESYFRKEINCNRLKIALDFFCSGSVFNGPVNFCDANIGGDFQGSNVVFLEQVSFKGVNIGRDLFMDRTQFKHKLETVHLCVMQVGGHASFSGANFYGPACFYGTRIGGDFLLNKIDDDEDNKKKKTFFLNKVDFSSSEIKINISFLETLFLNKEVEIDFSNIIIHNYAFFTKTVFRGNVSFLEGKFLVHS